MKIIQFRYSVQLDPDSDEASVQRLDATGKGISRPEPVDYTVWSKGGIEEASIEAATPVTPTVAEITAAPTAPVTHEIPAPVVARAAGTRRRRARASTAANGQTTAARTPTGADSRFRRTKAEVAAGMSVADAQAARRAAAGNGASTSSARPRSGRRAPVSAN